MRAGLDAKLLEPVIGSQAGREGMLLEIAGIVRQSVFAQQIGGVRHVLQTVAQVNRTRPVLVDAFVDDASDLPAQHAVHVRLQRGDLVEDRLGANLAGERWHVDHFRFLVLLPSGKVVGTCFEFK